MRRAPPRPRRAAGAGRPRRRRRRARPPRRTPPQRRSRRCSPPRSRTVRGGCGRGCSVRRCSPCAPALRSEPWCSTGTSAASTGACASISARLRLSKCAPRRGAGAPELPTLEFKAPVRPVRGRPPRRPLSTMTSTRRSDFDVTNSVQVSSPAAVLAAVEALYRPTWPGLSMEPLGRAFEHFERLFAGKVAGYHGVDTVYHDRQHTLDITLALARLIVRYERQQEESSRLGVARAVVGLVTGLFHDVGYLRRTDDKDSRNGAEIGRASCRERARLFGHVLGVTTRTLRLSCVGW